PEAGSHAETVPTAPRNPSRQLPALSWLRDGGSGYVRPYRHARILPRPALREWRSRRRSGRLGSSWCLRTGLMPRSRVNQKIGGLNERGVLSSLRLITEGFEIQADFAQSSRWYTMDKRCPGSLSLEPSNARRNDDETRKSGIAFCPGSRGGLGSGERRGTETRGQPAVQHDHDD